MDRDRAHALADERFRSALVPRRTRKRVYRNQACNGENQESGGTVEILEFESQQSHGRGTLARRRRRPRRRLNQISRPKPIKALIIACDNLVLILFFIFSALSAMFGAVDG